MNLNNAHEHNTVWYISQSQQFHTCLSVHAAHAVKVPQLEMLVVIHQVQHNELLEVRLIYPKLTIPLPVPKFPTLDHSAVEA